MPSFSQYAAYLRNLFEKHLWEIGYEEIIGPHGPLRERPSPQPWKEAVHLFVRTAVARDVAARVGDQDAIRNANQAMSALIDEYCGTPWRKWPWPGPPPQVVEIITELSLFANTLQAGGLRTTIEEVVGKIVTNGTIADRSHVAGRTPT